MSKARQGSNTSNRLSVANRTELLSKIGTREGELLWQSDIGLGYVWTTTQGTDNGGTVINVGTGSWIASYSGSINVTWFDAKGDGIADDTLAIQQALNIGGSILVPKGVFLFSALTLDVSGTTLYGLGKDVSIIKCTTTVGTAILVGNSSIVREDLNIKDLGIHTVNTRDVNAATLYTAHAHNVYFQGLQFHGVHGIAIWADGGANQFLTHIDGVEIYAASVGIGLGLTKSLGPIQDVWISDCLIASCSEAGIKLNHVSGIYASKIDIITSGNGIKISPENGAEVKALFFDSVLADTCTYSGWYIGPLAGGAVHDLNIVGCWGATSQGTSAGFEVADTGGEVNNISLVAFRAVNNKGNGIQIMTGQYISLVGCQSSGNSQAGSNTYDGLYLNNCSDISVTNGVYGGDNKLPVQQRHGILTTPSVTNYVITGAIVTNNISSGILDGMGNTGIIQHCIGYVGHLSTGNYLRNGACRVWQRGNNVAVTQNDKIYQCDGWKVTASTNTTCYSGADGDITVNGAAGFTSGYVTQPIEAIDAASLAGKPVTVQARVYSDYARDFNFELLIPDTVDGDAYTVLQTSTVMSHNGSSGYTDFSFTFSLVPSSVERGLVFRINLANGVDDGKVFGVTEMQLEEGSVATPFEHEDYGTTLAKCQRYYRRFTVGTGGYTQVISGLNHKAIGCQASVVLCPPMRVTPISADKSGNWKVRTQNIDAGESMTIFDYQVDASTPSQLVFNLEWTTAGISGAQAVVISDGDPSAYMEASAEL